jgi:redox-sensitive bicupin YhaK (pirin superfamily)
MENIMSGYRKIVKIIQGQATRDGAGVKLTRIFGFYEEGLLDPFLLLDFFGSDNPNDFMAGFPWHPHRGMETVTYMLDGKVEHGDSMGNSGVIGKGDIQWMTAGSGIIHQEMPKPDGGRMYGFQLWVNLPASRKMIAPRYRDIPAKEVPAVVLENQIRVRVIAGVFNGVRGPARDIIADPEYLDVEMPGNTEFIITVNPEHTVFAYLWEGEAIMDESRKDPLQPGQGAMFGAGPQVKVLAGNKGARFILISGMPIREPIAWRGPIVMNTQEELDVAFREFREGTFIKK